MKLIKIEGSLLSDADKIKEAIELLQLNAHENTTVTVAGNIDIEHEIEELLKNAIEEETDYTDGIKRIEGFYLNLIRTVIPVSQQSSLLSFVKQRMNELEDYCKGIQLLGEFPPKTRYEARKLPSIVLEKIFTAAYEFFLQNQKVARNTQEYKINICAAIIDPSVDMKIEDAAGRSDFAAAQLAVEKSATCLEYWTDRNFYYTADPELVKNSKQITDLSYEEAIELSNYDHKIIHPLALGMLIQKRIAIQLIHPKNISAITRITNSPALKKDIITGISTLDEISLISIEGSGMVGVPGFAKRVFACLHDANINIILISQGASEHSICVAVKSAHAENANKQLTKAFAREISSGDLQEVRQLNATSIIGLVGENMRSHPGISGRMFNALGRNGINVLAIAQGSNEKNISAVVHTSDKAKALNVLHEVFFEETKKEINLFVVGTGNVGKKLIAQVHQQFTSIEKMQNIRLNLVGLCNSRKMIIQKEGIELNQWEQLLGQSKASDLQAFADEIVRLNLRNSVLVDITANASVPKIYSELLKKSMSVVACNKIAASDSFKKYKQLKDLALEYNCKFLFETNVGAALPIIGTLNDIIKSGDQIKKIKAVLSGTLNYVFNHYDGSKPFSEIVSDAQQEGYTEPDPRLDLSGTDVMRKIMILAREAGFELEMEDINCQSFLPESCMNGTVEDFYKEMHVQEAHFKMLLEDATQNGAKLKFVASFENGKASVGLEQIQPESEMYHLYGKDNIVLFYTNRYDQQPLVVKGAGAGADVTASGVFADILRTINN